MSHLKNFIVAMVLVVISATTVFASELIEPTKQERYKMETGETVIEEIYEVEVSATSNDLIKEQFYDNGVKYVFSDVEEVENVYVEEKQVTVPKEHISATGNKDEIIANLEKEIPYEDEYGYKGTVSLDKESVVIKENEKSTKTWNKTETKVYENFMFKDNSVIPSTMTNGSGTKFKLQGVTWEVTQQELNGVGELVPTKYKAIATYGATLSSTTVDNYKVEVLYKGTVAKNMVEGKRVEIKYVSVPEEVVVDKAMDVEFAKAIGVIVLKLLGLAILILGIATGILFLIKYLKSLKGIEVYNYFDDGQGLHYVYLGKITIDTKTPVVDLNNFADEIQSSNFNFVVDRQTTNRLFGKRLGVTLDGITIMHEITTKGVEHTFKLTIGDSEDLLGKIIEKSMERTVEKTKSMVNDEILEEQKE